jgi:RHS repeat-associated protein
MRALHFFLFCLVASSFAQASLPHQQHARDGWRLVSELDGLNDNRVLAEYVAGPGYVDDVVAVRRDLNRDGDFDDTDEGFLYYLADQQHSTVALLDASGDVVERYGYDAFGAPSFYDAFGAPIAASAYGNDRLYTGRQWLPALGLYDYRQRMYDPAVGRFLTTDPASDPNNFGNPYTYVANNPRAFLDPYGDIWETPWDVASLGLGGASFVYNISQGDYVSAAVDAVDPGLDAAATVLPAVLRGAGFASP